ncbi:MAG: hypothetical protein IKP50_06580 [Bacilli bacterium]|nr:hypothetical protein [Bacilli bacterium]
MTFDKWFEEQALWLKIVLLIIPFVGWVMEILIRVSAVIRKSSTLNIVGLVIGVIGNWFWSVIDLIYMIIKGQLLLVE